MTLEKKTNHVAEAISRLIQQFRDPGSERLEALIASYVQQIQELENVSFELITDRTLDTATGVQLDGIGQIVGLERGGLDDTEYRLRLKVQIRLNTSNGTIEDVITVANLTTSQQSILSEYHPATIVVTIFDLTEDPDFVAGTINEARSAGVGFYLVYSPEPADEVFQFSSLPTTSETDSDQGFANLAQTTGGHFAGIATP
jgi:hypothetical protein